MNPVLTVADTERGVSDHLGAGPDPSVLLAGTAARQFLAARSLEEAENLAIRVHLEATGLSWGAIYRPADEVYRLSRVVHTEAAKLPRTLNPNLVIGVLEGVRRVGGCDERDLGSPLKGALMIVRIDSEFGLQPSILVLGATDPAVRSGVSLRAAEAVAEVSSAGLRNQELVDRLRSEVSVDFVTHCYNRRAFEEHLEVELVRAKRYERPLCLLLVDLDDFKEINDILGHQAGDYVLERVGATLRSAFRTTDRVCRYGGDEFAVIFPETPKEEVLRLAERLRRNISQLFPDSAIPSAITSSIGVASYPLDAVRSADLVKAADLAMYRAKEAGRNKVLPA